RRANRVAPMWLICTTMAAIGCAYTVFATLCVRAHKGVSPQAEGPPFASVSILKPLAGSEPGLAAYLASFMRQDYLGPYEILFGVQDRDDPGVKVVQELIGAHPPTHRLIVDSSLCGPNRKVSNLANLAAHARGEVMVLADSDIEVGPRYLSSLIGALARPGVGLVTCLYRGLPAGGLWSRLSAMAINDHFLPSVLAGRRLGLAQPCFGSTIALRRDTLARIGGFATFAHCLADDYAVGRAVRALGYDVAIPAMVVDHGCAEATFGELVRHELRWARTIRQVDPWGFAGSAVTHPLAFSLLGALLDAGAMAVGLPVASLACRLALQIQVDRVLGRSVGGVRWGPVRDLLSFAIFVGSFWPGTVEWRGGRLSPRPRRTFSVVAGPYRGAQ